MEGFEISNYRIENVVTESKRSCGDLVDRYKQPVGIGLLECLDKDLSYVE